MSTTKAELLKVYMWTLKSRPVTQELREVYAYTRAELLRLEVRS